MHWIVFCSDPIRAPETTAVSTLFSPEASKKHVVIKDFRNGFRPFEGGRIKKVFEELKGNVSPEVIFTHSREDRHQDHRLISDLTRNTWRDNLIMGYEIPKYDGDFGSPNFFVSLDEATPQKRTRTYLHPFHPRRRSIFHRGLFPERGTTPRH